VTGHYPRRHRGKPEVRRRIQQPCACREAACFCTALVRVDESYPPPELECQSCELGHHVDRPGGSRT